eukprot:TRINITY_DN6090_c0_g1_i1.p1 TRINITY_DN6090_c0_g1~~TRINITY_DN6090_c0_g1_i1.p1  ORF type:complete len:412 (-),score=51.80 TRINITY_DN6090_c0_g1_i1:730-1965(-)
MGKCVFFILLFLCFLISLSSSNYLYENLGTGVAYPISPRYGAVIGAATDILLIMGGWNDAHFLNDSWTYSLEHNQWKEEPHVSFKGVPTCYSQYENTIYILGKNANTSLMKVDIISLGNFSNVSSLGNYNITLPQRGSCCVGYDGDVDHYALYYFGGHLDSGAYSNKMYKFSSGGNHKEVNTSKDQPPQRAGTAFASWEGNCYMFGGEGPSGTLGDFWKYDTLHSEWVLLNSPEESGTTYSATGHSMSVVFPNQSIVLYGGRNNERVSGVVWEFNINTTTWTSKLYATPSYQHSSVYYRGRILIFGGFADGNITNTLREIVPDFCESKNCSACLAAKWSCVWCEDDGCTSGTEYVTYAKTCDQWSNERCAFLRVVWLYVSGFIAALMLFGIGIYVKLYFCGTSDYKEINEE